MLRPNGTNLYVHAYMNVRDTDIKPAADTENANRSKWFLD